MNGQTQAAAEGLPASIWLRGIALYKIAKAVVATLIAGAVLALVRPEVRPVAQGLIAALPMQAEQDFAQGALTWLVANGPTRIHLLSLAGFVYAGLFVLEGVGLWYRSHWAEWLTAVETSLLLPFELWELFWRPSSIKAMVLAANLAIVLYLLCRLRWRRRARGHPRRSLV
jgi:uncharacterized membrane protein (DUF2068 family)